MYCPLFLCLESFVDHAVSAHSWSPHLLEDFQIFLSGQEAGFCKPAYMDEFVNVDPLFLDPHFMMAEQLPF